ncbi:MAG: iron uptake transporter permease EfeU [Acidimicrobiia bacterium]
MVTTFIIGLREGLEAALIVGIVGAFLLKNSDRRSLRAMWAGVGLAVALCIAVAIGLAVVGQRLPLVARGIMEGTFTLIAVAGVMYMLVWMRHHSRDLRSDLEQKAADALGRNSTKALIALAFVAVIREGLETAVFLLAILGGSSRVGLGLFGAILGIGVASGLGYSIYRGGARINLARFFRVTGFVLVLVAAGLVASAIHEFAEAGVLTWGQSPAIDLTAIVAPGSLRAGLLTAFLGVQPVPTYAELAGWILFFVFAAGYVLRPQRTARQALSV